MPEQYRSARTALDAFISYSHTTDGSLGPALKSGVERFGRPWYRPRVRRVFLDNTNLALQSDLTAAIIDGLARSEWFLLLASPEAAASRWVNEEVAWWLAHRQPDRLLVLLTDGILTWDDAGTCDTLHTTSLPPALLEVDLPEPRWVDLREVRKVDLDFKAPAWQDVLADVVAAVDGVEKEQVIGEHIRQRRKTRITVAGVIATLVVLLSAAVIFATGERVQRNRAEEQARVATAQQMAALAVSNIERRLDLANLLAVAAYRLDKNPQTLSALHQVATASPHLVRFQPMKDRTTALASSRTGQYVVAGTSDGALIRWDVTSNAMESVQLDATEVLSIVVDDEASSVVASSASTVIFWKIGHTPIIKKILPVSEPEFDREVRSISVSPSGETAAIVDQDDLNQSVIRFFETQTGVETSHIFERRHVASVGYRSNEEIIIGFGSGEWRAVLVGSGVQTGQGGSNWTPGDSYSCCAYARGNSAFVWSKFGDVNLVRQGFYDVPGLTQFRQVATVPVPSPDVFAVDDSADRIALGAGGELYVVDVLEQGVQAEYRRLPGTGNIDALAFIGTEGKLVSATGRSLILWDLNQLSRNDVGQVVDAPSGPEAGNPPKIAIAPRGQLIAVAGLDEIVRLKPEGLIDSYPEMGLLVSDPFPIWSKDSSELVLLGDAGGENGAAAIDVIDNHTTFWPGRSTRDDPGASPAVLAAQIAPSGSSLVLVNEHGDVQVRSMQTGAIYRNLLSGLDNDLAPPFALRQNVAAISRDASTAAIIVPGSKEVRVIDTYTGQSHELTGSAASVVAFAEDRLVVGRTNNDTEIWNVTGTSRYHTIRSDAGYAQAITTVPGSRLIARLTDQGIVRLWFSDSARFLGSFALPQARGSGAPPWASTSLAATPDGTGLISATSSGSIVRWDLQSENWISAGCRAAGRSISVAEWKEYVGSNYRFPQGAC